MENKIELTSLTKENSDAIGFVIACLYASAIDLSELNQWAVSVIDRMDTAEIPDYIYDLVSYNESLAGIYKVIGFHPDWNCLKEEEDALYGIAIKKNRNVFDIPISPKRALQCLEKRSYIQDIFNQFFPFAAI